MVGWRAPSNRYDPESGHNPQLDSYEVDLDDCGPMALDALIWIKYRIDRVAD